MKTILALVSGTVVALTGCASQLERTTASGSYDYLEAQERASLKIPNDVDQPEFSKEYELPSLGENADKSMLGKELSVQSPSLVLPLVTGSHVQEGERAATVWFDQVDDSQPLDRAIWNSLLSFLEEQGIGVDSFDPDAGKLVTDWMMITKTVDSKWYKWTSTESKIGKRFEFSLEKKSHGRTAALHVELKDYMATTKGDVVASISDAQQRREEVDILNQVINHYEYQIQLEDSRKLTKIRQGLQMSMGFDANGHPAFVVDEKYDITWPRLLLVLRKLGFDVKDLDKSTGLLFVTYIGSESNWFTSWFSSDEELLEEDDYRLQVKKVGDKTSITFMDNESKPFEANMIADIFEPFKQVMSEDNLDI
ncbi:outer membrane protein assembly factor BamC [Alteromonas sp. ASW11-130]|uniref:outer membrane protein assembly factor BamC n=1 Tax=Alteromonas sp. ASW11-130 TaxID=3015775 RepID=UPI002241B7FB|nr:outer membrane protein assembly factor BamC [Alteromonas sp. ASW11-130]MCW8092415.1 outer membrane protein assembly factor BamC [Alteromonas sp. ASW11-130]